MIADSRPPTPVPGTAGPPVPTAFPDAGFGAVEPLVERRAAHSRSVGIRGPVEDAGDLGEHVQHLVVDRGVEQAVL